VTGERSPNALGRHTQAEKKHLVAIKEVAWTPTKNKQRFGSISRHFIIILALFHFLKTAFCEQ
jgi:hypothetical protein